MLLNQKDGWAIVTPPKTASTSMSAYYEEYYTGRQHDIPDANFTGTIYVTCRNPYSRAVSLWWHRLWDLAKPEGSMAKAMLDRKPFDEFLMERPSLTPFFTPQSYWYAQLPDGVKFLPIEDLNASLAKYDLLKHGVEIPRKNATAHKEYTVYYDDRLIEIVVRDFADDFKIFGYSQTLGQT